MTAILEREIKLRFETPEAARTAILRAGATPVRCRRLQEDCLLDTADETLRRHRCVLRVRVESGRSGSIRFALRAATDSAFGDVVMIPAGLGRPLLPWRGENMTGAAQAPAPTVLTIRFVRVEQGHVSGTLDPYADPQTGARLLTTFSGELKGNTIAGTYTTRLPSGESQTGQWSVQRR